MTKDQSILLVEKMVGRERIMGPGTNGRPDYKPFSPALYTVLRAVLGDKVPHVKDMKALQNGEEDVEAGERVTALAEMLGDVSDHLYELAGWEDGDESE